MDIKRLSRYQEVLGTLCGYSGGFTLISQTCVGNKIFCVDIMLFISVSEEAKWMLESLRGYMINR